LLSALVQNQPGVLAHVSGMFASRGFNIESLAVVFQRAHGLGDLNRCFLEDRNDGGELRVHRR